MSHEYVIFYYIKIKKYKQYYIDYFKFKISYYYYFLLNFLHSYIILQLLTKYLTCMKNKK